MICTRYRGTRLPATDTQSFTREWDYAPLGRDMCANAFAGTDFESHAETQTGGWARRNDGRIGTTYLKAQFVQYTDGTFSRVKHRDPEWKHLGNLGPLLRGEVGLS